MILRNVTVMRPKKTKIQRGPNGQPYVILDYSWRRQPGSGKRHNKGYYREKWLSPKKGSDKGPTMWYNWDEEFPV